MHKFMKSLATESLVVQYFIRVCVYI